VRAAPSRQSALPPGPRGALLQVPFYLSRADLYYQRCFRRYGDPFTEPTLYGPQVITARPEGVRRILSLPPHGLENFLPILGAYFGPTSLLVSNGDVHRQARRLLTPLFTTAHLRTLAPEIFELAARHSAALESGRRYEGMALGQAVTFDIIMRLVFGAGEQGRWRELRSEIAKLLEHATPLALAPLARPWFRRTLGHLPPWRGLRGSLARVDALLFDIIEHEAVELMPGSVFALLRDARDDNGRPLPASEIRDHLITLLVAGHETTASSVAWGIYELCRHPQALDEVRRRVRQHGPVELAADPYMLALTDELLRLHPISSRVGRVLREPLELHGWSIPAGVAVAASVEAVHRNPELYPEPERFRPERFLERSFGAHEYLAFGGGVRRCLGAPLARLELPLILGAWFDALNFERLDDRAVVPRRRALTYAPRGGVPVRVHRAMTG
jgi:cytochrome P450 family 110